MDEMVPGSFRLTNPKTKPLHPMTISNDFVTVFGFHTAEIEKIVKGKSSKHEERFPVIVVWDGNDISYTRAIKGDTIKIGDHTYSIDRDVDDVFSYLPSEEFIYEMATPQFLKELQTFEAKDLFDEVLKFYEHFFYFESKMLYHLVALFSINQCVHDAYNSTPYLYIRSPLEECGKSNLGKAIGMMWNGIISTNLDAHHVYRMVHGCSPTFVFDESKSWDLKGKTDPRMQALLSVINTGYQRGVPVFRFRDSGKGRGFGNMKPEKFDSYCPKVIISTQSSIPRDTQSRCAEIMMQRAPKDSPYADRWNEKQKGTNKLKREILSERIRRMAVLFRLKYGMEVKSLGEEGDWMTQLDHTHAFQKLSNRHMEIFKPLVILCLKYKPEWSDIFAKYVKEFIEMRGKVSYSKEMTVLWALRKAYHLIDESEGVYHFAEEAPIRFEEYESEGQCMMVTAKHIRVIIQGFEIGTIEEFGKVPETTIGRIFNEFGFVGTVKTGKGNYRKIKTSTLSDRCLNYLGVKLTDDKELSQQERMELLTRTIREREVVPLETLYDILNGSLTEEQVTVGVKELRKRGVIMAEGVGGVSKIMWCGVR